MIKLGTPSRLVIVALAAVFFLMAAGYPNHVRDTIIADLNGDGCIDIADVNAVINIMLGKNSQVIKTFTVNGVSFNMVEVEGGTFMMGATAEQASEALNNEKPPHQVTLSTFYIGQTEVTQELWVAIMGYNPSWFNGTGNASYGSTHTQDFGTNLQRPVEFVSWNECRDFVVKLCDLTGLYFSLPTEAQWEYAARGGSKSQGYIYAGSDSIDEVAWLYTNAYYYTDSTTFTTATQTVATKAPNELGLYDMSGNVCEWCLDYLGDYDNRPQTNPTGPPPGTYRVYRGGCWMDYAKMCRVSRRFGAEPLSAGGSRGLRLTLHY